MTDWLVLVTPRGQLLCFLEELQQICLPAGNVNPVISAEL